MMRFALHIKPLTPAQWSELLMVRRDLAKGRADTASFVLTKDAIGRGVEARWASESMDGTMPAMWKGARCGDDGHEADRTATQ